MCTQPPSAALGRHAHKQSLSALALSLSSLFPRRRRRHAHKAFSPPPPHSERYYRLKSFFSSDAECVTRRPRARGARRRERAREREREIDKAFLLFCTALDSTRQNMLKGLPFFVGKRVATPPAADRLPTAASVCVCAADGDALDRARRTTVHQSRRVCVPRVRVWRQQPAEDERRRAWCWAWRRRRRAAHDTNSAKIDQRGQQSSSGAAVIKNTEVLISEFSVAVSSA